MAPLQELAMHQGWIYEAIVSTFCDGEPHATPIGVWTDDSVTLRMEIYPSSRTLQGILDTGQFAACFPAEAAMFHRVLFQPESLVFDSARGVSAPVPRGCSATVALQLREAIASDTTTSVSAAVADVDVMPGLRLFNRAEALLVESLILATRLQYLDEAAARLQLAENNRVIRKVAPGSIFETTMSRLLEDIGSGS
jgi:hypothetical protein